MKNFLRDDYFISSEDVNRRLNIIGKLEKELWSRLAKAERMEIENKPKASLDREIDYLILIYVSICATQ